MPPTCVCYQAPFDLLFGTGKFGYATVVAVRSPVRTPGELRVGLRGLAEAAGWTPCALPQAGGSFRAQSPGRWMAAPCEEVHLHEHTAGRATLAVLGAGPKGLAIAAKRVALARARRDVPDLILIDRQGIAASSQAHRPRPLVRR